MPLVGGGSRDRGGYSRSAPQVVDWGRQGIDAHSAPMVETSYFRGPLIVLTETSHGLYYEANPVSAPPSQVNCTSSKREATSVLRYYKNCTFTGCLACFLFLQLDKGFTSSPPRLAHGGKLR